MVGTSPSPTAAPRRRSLVPRWLRATLVVGFSWVLARSSSEPVHYPPEVVQDPERLDVVGVRITVPAVPDHPWGVETVGHVLALTERALAELPAVVPTVAGSTAMPGLSQAPLAVLGSLSLGLTLVDERLTVRARFCDVANQCFDRELEAERTTPNAAIVRLVREIGVRLGRPDTKGLDVLATPETADPYAALLLGRSAAVSYGLLPAVGVEQRGDPRADPIVRAVFLDPGMVTAQALLARSSVTAVARRVEAAQLAVQADGSSAARLADLAAVFDEVGQAGRALERWRAVGARAPKDARFFLPRARAELRDGHVREARGLIDALPAGSAEDPRVLALRVELAELEGGVPEALLVRWSERDPNDPEPIRRRIALAVASGQREAALTLADELGRRGAVEDAQRIRLALANELGRWEEAARAAGALGATDVAKLLAAAGAERDPVARLAALSGLDAPEARLGRADALLDLRRLGEALEEVEAVLDVQPWRPEALDRLARVHEAQGDRPAARAARARLAFADPAYLTGAR